MRSLLSSCLLLVAIVVTTTAARSSRRATYRSHLASASAHLASASASASSSSSSSSSASSSSHSHESHVAAAQTALTHAHAHARTAKEKQVLIAAIGKLRTAVARHDAHSARAAIEHVMHDVQRLEGTTSKAKAKNRRRRASKKKKKHGDDDSFHVFVPKDARVSDAEIAKVSRFAHALDANNDEAESFEDSDKKDVAAKKLALEF